MRDDDMAEYPGLTRRNGVWHVRKRIPADLQHFDTRGSIRISLGTTDKRQAVRLYHLKLAEIEMGFERLREDIRARPFVETALATGRIEDLGSAALEALVRDWWDKRALFRKPPPEASDCLEDPIQGLRADAAIMTQAQAEGRDLAADFADRLLVEAGVKSAPYKVGKIKTAVRYPLVDGKSAAYARLRALVAEGLRFEAMLAMDHATGAAKTPSHPIFNPTGLDTMKKACAVGDLIQDYRKERERLHGVESTARKYGLLFRVVEECWGLALPTSEITRQHCVDLVTFIEKLPANGTKKFPGMSLTQSIVAAEAGGDKLLAPNTVASYVQGLSAVLRWAKMHGYGVTVSTEGLKPKRDAEVERRGMTADELRLIFKRLAAEREAAPHKFWIPALAAYTGARAEELCQLRTEDVIEVDGVTCLNLTRFDPTGRAVKGKRFKNRQSERIVPVHPELLDTGFRAYVDECDPAGRLFPALTPGARGNHSHNFSKWFGRFMDSIGLSNPSLVFHSFRHGFRDACRIADIADDTAHALGGWAAVNQGQRYGNRSAVPLLHRALQRVSYGDFRLQDVIEPRATMEV
jgi:integrase